MIALEPTANLTKIGEIDLGLTYDGNQHWMIGTSEGNDRESRNSGGVLLIVFLCLPPTTVLRTREIRPKASNGHPGNR